MYLPLANLIPAFLAADTPELSCSYNVMFSYSLEYALQISALLSVLPSLTKIISILSNID